MSQQSSVRERVRKALQELGLTEYESRTYITLVENGPMTASEISEAAQVPYSKVYEVLGALDEKGFIETHGGRPARYVPKSPATALESLRLRLEKRLRGNEETILSELMPIYEKRGAKERPDIWILRGEASIMETIRDVSTRCEQELLIAAPALNKGIVMMIQSIAGAAHTRGCQVQIMVSNTVEQSFLTKLLDVAEVRVRDQMFGGGVIADSREVVIVFSGDDGSGLLLAIWSDHPGLAKYARNYFGYLWNDATQIRRK
ncbi:MAG: TrmB family transcriptional regulator [Aigarchaeota archaeon]|nr:TrmB family transcriptional regulator [Candidatus Pelearchaeum maunauluense]